MADRYLPTEQERAAISEILSWRARLVVILIFSMLSAALGRLIVTGNGWPAVALAGAGLVVLLGAIVYVSFFLRCPRCKSWVGVAVPKCASCGLKFEGL